MMIHDLFSHTKAAAWLAIAVLGVCAVITLFVVGGHNETTIQRNNAAQVMRIERNRVSGEELLYHNQLEACGRGNLLRSVTFNFAEDAADAREAAAVDSTGLERIVNQRAAEHYRKEAERLRTAPFANADGTINCHAAIKPPPTVAQHNEHTHAQE